MASWKYIAAAPRWAGLSSFIKDECFHRNLALKIDVDRGWLREHVRLEVFGDEKDIDGFRACLIGAIKQYNKS